MLKNCAFVLCAALLVSACGGGGSGGGGSGGGSGSNSSSDAGQTGYASVASRGWTLPAGTEGYKCVGVPVTADMEITSLRPVVTDGISAGILTVGTGGTTGEFDCGPGTLGTRLLMAFGKGSGEVALPPSASFHVSAGEMLMLNLHIHNTSTTSVASGTASVEVRQAAPGVTLTGQAQAFLAGTFLINIPSDNLVHTAAGVCYANNSHDIFAITPVMRSTGVQIAVDRTHNNVTTPVLHTPFAFGHESVASLSPAASLVSGDRIVATCSYQNNTGATKIYGEYDNNEECFATVYSVGTSKPGIFDCAQGNSI